MMPQPSNSPNSRNSRNSGNSNVTALIGSKRCAVMAPREFRLIAEAREACATPHDCDACTRRGAITAFQPIPAGEWKIALVCTNCYKDYLRGDLSGAAYMATVRVARARREHNLEQWRQERRETLTRRAARAALDRRPAFDLKRSCQCLGVMVVCLAPVCAVNYALPAGALHDAVVAFFLLAGLIGAWFLSLSVGDPLEVAPNE